MRAYCLVDRCGETWTRLVKRKSSDFKWKCSIQAYRDFLIWSVISKCTGKPVFYCVMIARAMIWFPWEIYRNLSLTKSQPRSLLSIARLNKARSRIRYNSSRRILIDQISFSLSGDFCPTSLPLFHGSRLHRLLTCSMINPSNNEGG